MFCPTTDLSLGLQWIFKTMTDIISQGAVVIEINTAYSLIELSSWEYVHYSSAYTRSLGVIMYIQMLPLTTWVSPFAHFVTGDCAVG